MGVSLVNSKVGERVCASSCWKLGRRHALDTASKPEKKPYVMAPRTCVIATTYTQRQHLRNTFLSQGHHLAASRNTLQTATC